MEVCRLRVDQHLLSTPVPLQQVTNPSDYQSNPSRVQLLLSFSLDPQGVEATLFAALMSILNGGSFTGSFLGSLLTRALGVDGKDFTNLAPLVCFFLSGSGCLWCATGCGAAEGCICSHACAGR